MGQLTWAVAALLGAVTRLLPAGRRDWTEAVRAEAGQVPAGWPRLRWLAGGLRLVAREANVVRKVMYLLGIGAVAAATAWTVWLSWRASPATEPQVVTDRFRVLAGAAALVLLPWVGRRRGWFGPVANGITARLLRMIGCAAICGLGLLLMRLDSQAGLGPHGPGPFSLTREIAGLAVLGAVLAAVAMQPLLQSRWPEADAVTVWSFAGLASVFAFVALPVQIIVFLYVAGILAATSRRSLVAIVSSAAGIITGIAAAVSIYGIANAVPNSGFLMPIAATVPLLLAAPAGVAAAWLLPGADSFEDPEKLRQARIRQGVLAGAVSGVACGLLLTLLDLGAVFMMAVGPVAGALGATAGAGFAVYHPRRSGTGDSDAASLLAAGS